MLLNCVAFFSACTLVTQVTQLNGALQRYKPFVLGLDSSRLLGSLFGTRHIGWQESGGGGGWW